MTMHPQAQWKIPLETERVALAIFKKGNIYVTIAQKLGQIYEDIEFQSLFCPNKGQSAISPARLALITIFQFLEGLTDRQTAEAVRARIDWKYALGLELTDQGFDFSVLSEWRQRLIMDDNADQLLNKMLIKFKNLNLIKERTKQRTDSTH
jgi:transposase